MSFYSDMAEMAREQIEEYGRTVILRRNNEGAYNADTDTMDGGTVSDVSVKVLFTEYRQNEIDNTIILRGDKKILIADAALGFAPQHNDIIVDGTDHYKVINLSTVQPGDTPLLYKLQVRK
jgi:hypothetical protein